MSTPDEEMTFLIFDQKSGKEHGVSAVTVLDEDMLKPREIQYTAVFSKWPDDDAHGYADPQIAWQGPAENVDFATHRVVSSGSVPLISNDDLGVIDPAPLTIFYS